VTREKQNGPQARGETKMVGTVSQREAVHALARSSFSPRNRRQAIAQCLSVTLDRRAFAAESGSIKFGLNWQVARLSLTKAKAVRDAADWEMAFFADMG
jgi:hypothetical protein